MGKLMNSAISDSILFDSVLSTTMIPVFWKDADRRFLGANRAFLEYYGFAGVSVILGKNDEDMGWHSEPDPYKNDELRVLSEGISTYRVPGKCMARGMERNIVASKSPIVDGGRIVGLVGSFEDVTGEVRQREEIVRLNHEMEEHIREHDRLMNVSDVVIVKVRLADYTFAEYNDAMYRKIGFTRDEYEKSFHHSMEAYFTGGYEEELLKLKRAVSEAMEKGRESFSLEMKLPAKNGAAWISGEASFCDIDPETGKPASLYAVYRDVTDIVETQQKLAKAEIEAEHAAFLTQQNRRMRRMLDTVPTGLGAIRITGGVPNGMIQLNRFFFERMDIEDEGNGMAGLGSFTDCVHPDDRERCRSDFQSFLREKELCSEQYRFRSALTGRYRWLNVRADFLTISERKQIAYFAFTDIDDMKRTEAELKESHSLYERTVNALQVGLWKYDIPNRRIIMGTNASTKALCRKLGWPEVFENAPEGTLQTIEPEDQQKYLQAFRDIEEGKDAVCEVWYRRQPGVEPHCERETYHVEFDENGKPSAAYAIGQNITAEKKVRERYEREMHYLRHNSDESLIAKGHYNLTKNIVLEYENSMRQKVYSFRPGISYDDAYRGMLKFSYSDADRREIEDKLNRENLISRYQHGEMHTTLEYRRSVEQDEPIWISMTVHTYMMPETGDIELFSYAYNISERKMIDKVMGTISDVEFDYIGFIYAKTGQFEFIKRRNGILFPEIRQKTDYGVCCDYVRSHFVNQDECSQFDSSVSLDNILKGLKDNGRFTSTYRRTEENRLFCKQLDYVWFDQEAEIIIVVRSDVTAAFRREQKQLRQIEAAKLEAVRANEEKSAFLSSMSHDMRTPLNGVLSFTRFALKEEDPRKKQEYLEKIDASGKLLMDLVSDTLDLSRLESGKATLEMQAVLPDELVKTVVTALQPSAELKGIRLTEDLRNNPGKPLWCDKLKVQKIVLNLLSNAIKYTPEGGEVFVRQDYQKSGPSGPVWHLIVEDNGIGMSRTFMERMYEPFTQEKRSEAVNTPGTGLGLALIKRYIDLMAGTIEVNSRVHQGTRWEVRLPIREAEEISAAGETPPVDFSLLQGKHILLCEDNDTNTEIATMLLKDRGMEVAAAADGEEGIERFLESPEGGYDDILMDIRMPKMDGFTAAGKIRSSGRKDAGTVPIIAMTADVFDESLRKARECGMNDYVTKPFEPDKLYSAIVKGIKERSGEEANEKIHQ